MPWSTVASTALEWLGKGLAAIFSFLKSDKADHQSVNQMQKDINAELREDIKGLKAELIAVRKDYDEKLRSSEEREDKCLKRLSRVVKNHAVLREKVKQLLEEKEERDVVRSEREKPAFVDRTIQHTTQLIREESSPTKLEGDQ